MHVGDPEEASGSWLLSIPALVTVAILGVNQLMEDCFLFVSPLLFVFQINKIKQPALINSPYTCLECMETARLKTPVLTRAAGQSNALPPGLVEIGDDVRDDPDSLCLCNMNHISGRERSAMCKDKRILIVLMLQTRKKGHVRAGTLPQVHREDKWGMCVPIQVCSLGPSAGCPQHIADCTP